MQHSERKHAKMSASGSARWLACPGSVKAEEGCKDQSNFAADEGTCAHEVCEKSLLSGKHPTSYIGETFNGIVVDSEMAIYAGQYVEYVTDIVNEDEKSILMVEQRVDFSNVVPEGFGTLDASSLHMVMNALDQLQNQGRKVVLISHIQEMHERIPVQIQVRPLGSGASDIHVVS